MSYSTVRCLNFMFRDYVLGYRSFEDTLSFLLQLRVEGLISDMTFRYLFRALYACEKGVTV